MNNYFSNNIKYIRRVKKISQIQLADNLGLKYSAISAWENKRSYPSVDILLKISTLFTISIDDLLKKDLSKVEFSTLDGLNPEPKNPEFNQKYIKALEQIIKDNLPGVAAKIGLT